MAKVETGIGIFGVEQTKRDTLDILREESEIGVAEIDRGGRVWNPDANDGDGAYEDDPCIVEELAVELAFNEGKGTGVQTISENDYDEFLSSLDEIIEADFERPGMDPEEYMPPAEVVRQSWRMVHPKKTVINDKGKKVQVFDKTQPRCMVQFRTRNGRGSKPAVIHRDQLPAVLQVLRGLHPVFDAKRDECWQNYRAVKAAKAAAEAAKRQAELEAQQQANVEQTDSEE